MAARALSRSCRPSGRTRSRIARAALRCSSVRRGRSPPRAPPRSGSPASRRAAWICCQRLVLGLQPVTYSFQATHLLRAQPELRAPRQQALERHAASGVRSPGLLSFQGPRRGRQACGERDRSDQPHDFSPVSLWPRRARSGTAAAESYRLIGPAVGVRQNQTVQSVTPERLVGNNCGRPAYQRFNDGAADASLWSGVASNSIGSASF